ncbi:uncharacterized protein LOC105178781 [Sesamum indicum]|uniref:Uncharacterized protein LOC105178781 n=1 Tax=Sesamum indicum TaxID=4182 RepID=A0A6I9UJT2_SESIN|nr:uncharacterized protein LOC105178781 [Sesamum indicum]
MAEDPEILKLQPGDNSAISLVTTLFDGMNFLSWSRSIKLALTAKMKLSFINGENKKPEKNAKEFEQWIRTDSMVASWILNSIKRKIADCFMYTNTSRALWKELKNRYGQSNGPMEYQLKKELGATTQGTMSLSAYFSKLMRLWDELAFYDNVRSQVLVMEPRPDINKAYSMVLNVEKQREVNFGQPQTAPNMAMQDLKTREIIGIGCLVGNLYVIKTESFDKRFIEDVLTNFRNTGFIAAKTYKQPINSIIEDEDDQDTLSQPNPETIEETPVIDQQEHEQMSDDMNLRRSRRQNVRPTKFQDYVCVCKKEDNDILTVKLQNNMNTYINTVSDLPVEPSNYSEAMNDKEWIEAMKS